MLVDSRSTYWPSVGRLLIEYQSIGGRLSAFDDLQSIPSISRLIVGRLTDHRHSADTSVNCWFR